MANSDIKIIIDKMVKEQVALLKKELLEELAKLKRRCDALETEIKILKEGENI